MARIGTIVVAAVVCLLGFSSPVHADGLPRGFETLFAGSEEVFLTAAELELLTDLRNQYLKLAEQLVKPCLRKEDAACQTAMIAALNSALRYARPGDRARDLLAVIRNGQFRYRTAFALRLLNAVIRQGGGCSEWTKRAAANLSDGTPLTLAVLLATARIEVGGLTRLPESNMLAFVERRLTEETCQPITAANDSIPVMVMVER